MDWKIERRQLSLCKSGTGKSEAFGLAEWLWHRQFRDQGSSMGWRVRQKSERTSSTWNDSRTPGTNRRRRWLKPGLDKHAGSAPRAERKLSSVGPFTSP